jgi:hypothetical protein
MPPDAAPKLADVVSAVVARLDPDRIGTGPLAMLRRLDPAGSLAVPALQRLLWQHVPDKWLEGGGLRRWALLIHAMALAAPDLLRGGNGLGRALHAAGYSEGRLIRLLEARAEDLPGGVPRMVRFMVAKGEALDPLALAWFVHGVAAGGDAAERQRERIAGDYYRAERDANRPVSPSAPLVAQERR